MLYTLCIRTGGTASVSLSASLVLLVSAPLPPPSSSLLLLAGRAVSPKPRAAASGLSARLRPACVQRVQL